MRDFSIYDISTALDVAVVSVTTVTKEEATHWGAFLFAFEFEFRGYTLWCCLTRGQFYHIPLVLRIMWKHPQVRDNSSVIYGVYDLTSLSQLRPLHTMADEIESRLLLSMFAN
jgi:hypothetical protein